MKRKESALRLGFTFAGCYLGAGYVSGQELWQFFGCFGWQGIAGLPPAVALSFFSLGYCCCGWCSAPAVTKPMPL